ncbi:MAG: 1-deoxy-D-xylulose-5-phosphate reductoisomerase [Phycisphaerales bacterium]|nr:1-deoxy-D-xylulose-5-phosphate reductoisomerase [Phycisphaerales bacterium]
MPRNAGVSCREVANAKTVEQETRMQPCDPSNSRRLIILGSTGSIGVNTLEVVHHLASLEGHHARHFRIVGLAAGRNAELLESQAAMHEVLDVAVAHPPSEHVFSSTRQVRTGGDAACQLVRDVARPGDLVVAAMVGSAGIPAVLEAVRIGCDIALANKETLVAAGSLVTAAAASSGSRILPVDSEHSAVFQAMLAGRDAEDVAKVVLTASGGPFREWSTDRMQAATVEDALSHPTWKMGRKVTIDSASLMNKGLELIEAHWLFDLPVGKLDAIVHPQSIVHSFVEFIDGSVIAQLSPPDMRMPIQYALTWPERSKSCSPRLDFSGLQSLVFERVDHDRFPAIGLAKQVIESGGTAGAVFNAANEAAVEAFLSGVIPFGRLGPMVAEAVDRIPARPADSMASIEAADAEARELVRNLAGMAQRS